MSTTTMLAFVLGLAVGAAIATALMHARIADRRALSDQLKAMCSEAVTQSGRQLLDLTDARGRAAEDAVAPVKDSLDRFDARLREMERSRIAIDAALREQIEAVRLTGETLRRETGALASALRKPQVRGRWGELHLARATELAGLVDHCDVTFQHTTTDTGDGTHRPDLVVHLTGGKHIVVDAKVPLQGFLEAAEATDDDARDAGLRDHARQTRQHVDSLADKAYWRRLPATPEFVVLFMPGEAFLSHALEVDPGLLEYAAARKVVLATPTTLIALLRTVAYAWNEQSLTDNAREVFELGRELYRRLGTFGGHLDRLGRSLGTAVTSYNEAVGSLETRVLVSARRLHELKLTSDELDGPTPIEHAVRPLAAAELVTVPEPADHARRASRSDRSGHADYSESLAGPDPGSGA